MNSAIIRLVALVGCIVLTEAVPVAVQGQGSVSSSIVLPIPTCTQSACLFSYTNPDNVNQGRCGEVDAAPRMPADIWNDRGAVGKYVQYTTELYHLEGVKLVQAPCNHTGHVQKGSKNVSWTTPELMKICTALCNCIFPNCPDQPDKPHESYCSLCGPKFNAPIEVKFWYPLHPNIVDRASATADLSILVKALDAAALADTLSGPGPFTVFAPTDLAFDRLPPGTLAKLLDPKNVKELQSILLYHVVSGYLPTADFGPKQNVTTVNGESVLVVSNFTQPRFGLQQVFVNQAKVTTANVICTNGIVHIINSVLLP